MDRGDLIAGGSGGHSKAKEDRQRSSTGPPPLSKSALGRGLDQLMDRDDVASSRDSVSNSNAILTKVEIQAGPGLGTLLRGSPLPSSKNLESMDSPSTTASSGFSNFALMGSLIGADLLLLSEAAFLTWRIHRPFGFGEVLFALLCVGFGAWLSCLAILIQNGPKH